MRLISFQSYYVIIAENTLFCNIGLTLFNMFFIIEPIETRFFQIIVHIKAGCFIGGIERIIYIDKSIKISEVQHLHKASNSKFAETEIFHSLHVP